MDSMAAGVDGAARVGGLLVTAAAAKAAHRAPVRNLTRRSERRRIPVSRAVAVEIGAGAECPPLALAGEIVQPCSGIIPLIQGNIDPAIAGTCGMGEVQATLVIRVAPTAAVALPGKVSVVLGMSARRCGRCMAVTAVGSSGKWCSAPVVRSGLLEMAVDETATAGCRRGGLGKVVGPVLVKSGKGGIVDSVGNGDDTVPMG